MKRYILLSALLLSIGFAQAQTIYKISNVTITENQQVVNGMDVSAVIKGSEGSDRVVIYAGQDMTLESKVKVSTQNVKRSSVKSSAVNAIFEINLKVAGDKDNRRVEKVYYMDQERKSHFKEKFVFKEGNKVRVITVEFDGSLE
jgi:phospholipase/lecithinase/hemolysin